ncbi:MAG: efflux RND transporter periplasmic adaptor subunit [Pseudomonadota bacterium]
MPALKKRTLGLGALTAVTIGVIAAVTSGAKTPAEADNFAVLRVRTIPIEIQEAYEAKATFPGRVRAGRRSQLGFERGGRLAAVSADEGDVVKQGTMLAQLDQRQLKAQLTAANAQINAAAAGLKEAQASQNLASATQERQKALLAKGHISQQRFDDSTYRLRAANAAVSTAQARLAQAKAETQSVTVALDLSQLDAPFDGFIVKRMADEGTILGAGTPIFDFEESGRGEFVSGVPIDVAQQLRVGQAMDVQFGTVVVTAKLSRIVSAVDTATRTAQLVFALPEGTALASGEIGQLALTQPRTGPGFWVPMEALQEGARGLWTVFVAAPEGTSGATIERHPVELLYSELQKAFVRGTPDDGAQVVTSGVSRLVPGQRVTLANQS